MASELVLKFIKYFPDYLSALSRTLLRFFVVVVVVVVVLFVCLFVFWTTFVETAVYITCTP